MSHWNLEYHGKVALLTFSRLPDNLMDIKSMAELAHHLDELGGQSDEVSVVMLTGGVDGYFIKHADLADIGRKARGEVSSDEEAAWARAMTLLEEIPQPTVAAVDGQAWGGGLETALACTLRVGSQRAHVGQPEIWNGIIPGGGGTQRLPRTIGHSRAADLILTGRVVGAREAHDMGIFNAVLPTGGFLLHALTWCGGLARHAPRALFAAKEAMVRGRDLPLGEGLAMERKLFSEVVATGWLGAED
ncbi:enoyl-CoA hydratase/isomerase family protein [Streptomyces vinaceus]|uniref:enoyl-CoA hydratase/isomerase family protein n=1 Tax=Streptomyces vinaceus TaxID=1960 RepID=UPI00381C6E61